MKTLYVTSVERYSGKTAVCLALGKHFQKAGLKVGYLKPLSTLPWRIGSHIADEDAAFAKQVLGLAAEPWELSPVVMTKEFLRAHIGEEGEDLMAKVENACMQAGAGQDVLLLEGGSTLREGYSVRLPTPYVAERMKSAVLVVLTYRDGMRILDDALGAKNRLREAMCGVIINRVPQEALEFVHQVAKPNLEDRGVHVYGVLPEERLLAALTVGELINVLGADVLTKTVNLNALVESLTVGAMTAEAASRRFRRYSNKAVITGGDRTDIQLAALETSTACLILTGNLIPSSLVVKHANQMGVAVLLVCDNTMETVGAIERVFGKTRLAQPNKLNRFLELVDAHVEVNGLLSYLEIKS